MSAALRVAHAAETIRARWELRTVESPQVEAAQALEDSGQLLNPEVVAELRGLRSRVAELKAKRADEHDELAMALGRSNSAEWGDLIEFAAGAVSVEVKLRARIEELEAERHSTNESLDDAVQELRARQTGPALPWAHTMPDDDLSGFLNDLVSAAVNRWQSDPEVPDRETLAAVEKACAAWRTPGQGYRSDEDEAAEVPPLLVFRASHESIVMGHYDNRQAAMDHVHATLANEEGGDVTARVIWRADDPEADEPTWECWLFDADMADDKPTGYVVTPLEVASAYDGEADE